MLFSYIIVHVETNVHTKTQDTAFDIHPGCLIYGFNALIFNNDCFIIQINTMDNIQNILGLEKDERILFGLYSGNMYESSTTKSWNESRILWRKAHGYMF